jgi:hypothetical protein
MCIVLVKTNKQNNLPRNSDSAVIKSKLSGERYITTYKNLPWTKFVAQFKREFSSELFAEPLMDAMELPADAKISFVDEGLYGKTGRKVDIELLKKILAPYGVGIVHERRWADVLVVRDKKE